jgi:hypothetical protein
MWFPALDRVDDGGGVADRVRWKVHGSAHRSSEHFPGSALTGSPCQGYGFECETDAGMGGAGVAIVNAEGQPQGCGFEGDVGLFLRLADSGAQDALAVFEVAAGRSARVRRFPDAYR